MYVKASKRNNYHYNKKLQGLARVNRSTMTKSAACMWKYILGARHMLGYQFRRERPILNYIADFVCLDLLPIIEVDGVSHHSEEAIKKDEIRDRDLAAVGFTTLRFSSDNVLNRIDQVAGIIGSWIKEHGEAPPPNPRQRGK